jgi:hypothetical protein
LGAEEEVCILLSSPSHRYVPVVIGGSHRWSGRSLSRLIRWSFVTIRVIAAWQMVCPAVAMNGTFLRGSLHCTDVSLLSFLEPKMATR